MSSFSDTNFVKKLSELNNTQQSIQTLSLWLIHHRKNSKSIVQIWHRELQKVVKAHPSKRLTFLYLANDVIQNSKKKGSEFMKDFKLVLPESFKVAAKDADDRTKKSMERILGIWEERGVYNKEIIKQIRSDMGLPKSKSTSVPVVKEKHEKRKHTEREQKPREKKHKSAHAAGGESQSKKKKKEEQLSLKEEIDAMAAEPLAAPDADVLVAKLTDLEQSASCDAAVREKIATLPSQVSDISHLSKITDRESANELSNQVNDACDLLNEYNKRLSAELDERKNVARMLQEFIKQQKDLLDQRQSKLAEYKDKLSKVSMVRQELKSHIQNLPDLTQLPDVTGGLAPLPSAMDLFSL
ncbi:hypothetical protein ScPMuIL_000812 [Solemya velum]